LHSVTYVTKLFTAETALNLSPAFQAAEALQCPAGTMSPATPPIASVVSPARPLFTFYQRLLVQRSGNLFQLFHSSNYTQSRAFKVAHPSPVAWHTMFRGRLVRWYLCRLELHL